MNVKRIDIGAWECAMVVLAVTVISGLAVLLCPWPTQNSRLNRNTFCSTFLQKLVDLYLGQKVEEPIPCDDCTRRQVVGG